MVSYDATDRHRLVRQRIDAEDVSQGDRKELRLAGRTQLFLRRHHRLG
jgi:hypothetical protein